MLGQQSGQCVYQYMRNQRPLFICAASTQRLLLPRIIGLLFSGSLIHAYYYSELSFALVSVILEMGLFLIWLKAFGMDCYAIFDQVAPPVALL